MFDRAADARRYPPTARHLRQARARGDVACSPYLTGVAVLGAAAVLAAVAGPAAVEALTDHLTTTFARSADAAVLPALSEAAGVGGRLALVFAAVVFAVAALVGAVQAGPIFSAAAVSPDFSRLWPGRHRPGAVSGHSRVVAAAAVMGLTGVFVAVAAFVLRAQAQSLAHVVAGPPAAVAGLAVALLGRVVAPALAVAAVVAGLDLLYRKLDWRARHRMTRGELQAEIREERGHPQIMRARRRLGRQLAAPRPAPVWFVVKGPLLAVALRYEAEADAAPRVIEVAAGPAAAGLVQDARRRAAGVLHAPNLARALASHSPGRPIPAHLFGPVADALVRVSRQR